MKVDSPKGESIFLWKRSPNAVIPIPNTVIPRRNECDDEESLRAKDLCTLSPFAFVSVETVVSVVLPYVF